MVEKFISYTITEIYRKDVNEEIGTHCFEFLKKTLNNMIHTEYLARDREDFITEKSGELDGEDDIEEPLFYNQNFVGRNCWEEICEPV